MPYKTKKIGSKSCVYKKNTGRKVGCTTGPVKKYLAALHINAHESKTPKKITQKDVMTGVRKPMPPPSTQHKDKKDYDRKKFKTFRDYWETVTGMDGSQKVTDDTTATAEGVYAPSDDEGPGSVTGYDTYANQDGPNSPLNYESKKKTKDKALTKAISYLTKFVDAPMPAEGEELEVFLKDLQQMADELQKTGVDPVDIIATIKQPNMATQYLIRGPSAKGNSGKGALQDLQDLKDYNLLEDEEAPSDNPTVTAATTQGIEGENFIDGKHPGRKGLAKRSGVNTKASVSTLRNVAKHSSGEKARMAHWMANMKAGKAKHHK